MSASIGLENRGNGMKDDLLIHPYPSSCTEGVTTDVTRERRIVASQKNNQDKGSEMRTHSEYSQREM